MPVPLRDPPPRLGAVTATQTPPPRPAITDAAARTVEACKTYGAGDTLVKALDHVTVEFERGRFTAIMGPSGSGKSPSSTAWPDSIPSPQDRSSSAMSI